MTGEQDYDDYDQESEHRTKKPSAHERLWELSQAKKLNHVSSKKGGINHGDSAFDKELSKLQECTFTP